MNDEQVTRVVEAINSHTHATGRFQASVEWLAFYLFIIAVLQFVQTCSGLQQ